MAVVHISEADLARDVHAVLDRVQSGAKVIVERDAKPIAILRAPEAPNEGDEYSRIREEIVAAGHPMLSDDEVRAEIRNRKGGRDDSES